ncbi:MAG: OmpA family protein, partial [Gallionellaceae bacterium]|nr:OmpA family protein [Gallionellaceae bacterium]
KDDEITTLQQQKAELEKQRVDLEKQKADLDQKKAALEQQVSALVKRKSELEQQSAQLEKDKIALEQQRSSLESQNTAIQQQVSNLEQQKAALLAASQSRQQQYDELVKNLSQEVEKGQLQVRQYQNMLSVDLAEKIFFDSGRATLKSGGKEVLKKVGEVLKGYEDKVIRVVGHTDNVPIAKTLQSVFPTNWELSVARATTVVRFLEDVGVPPERMVAAGRSKYDPVDTNDTAEGRQNNRRIEIMIIDQSLVNTIEKPGS